MLGTLRPTHPTPQDPSHPDSNYSSDSDDTAYRSLHHWDSLNVRREFTTSDLRSEHFTASDIEGSIVVDDNAASDTSLSTAKMNEPPIDKVAVWSIPEPQADLVGRTVSGAFPSLDSSLQSNMFTMPIVDSPQPCGFPGSPASLKGITLVDKVSFLSPDINRCLRHVRHRRRIPSSFHDSILALSAISVFLRPADSAHWIFWSGLQERKTFALVDKALSRDLCYLRDSLGWITSTHGEHVLHVTLRSQDWHTLLATRSWYNDLVLPTFPPTIKGHNLRKRNQDQRRDPDELPQELPAKRARTHKSRLSAPPAPTTLRDTSDDRPNFRRNQRPKPSPLILSGISRVSSPSIPSPISASNEVSPRCRERSISSAETLVEGLRTRSSSRLSMDTLLGTPVERGEKSSDVYDADDITAQTRAGKGAAASKDNSPSPFYAHGCDEKPSPTPGGDLPLGLMRKRGTRTRRTTGVKRKARRGSS